MFHETFMLKERTFGKYHSYCNLVGELREVMTHEPPTHPFPPTNYKTLASCSKLTQTSVMKGFLGR